MQGHTTSLAERRAALAVARDAVVGLRDVLVCADGPELAELVGELDELTALAGAARVVVAAEAVTRGEIATTLPAWLRQCAPSLRQGGVSPMARLVTDVTKGGPVWSGGVQVDEQSPLGIVWAAVTTPGPSIHAEEPVPVTDDGVTDDAATDDGVTDPDGSTNAKSAHAEGGDPDASDDATDAPSGVITTSTAPVSPAVGVAVLGEVQRLAPRLLPEVLPTVTRVLLDLAREWGPGHMRRFRAHLLAQYGAPGELHDVQDKLAKAAYLSSPHVEETGLTTYGMAVTPEQAATLEAAIGPLSAPAPNNETGERDLRPAGQRRIEALIEVVRRAQAMAADAHGSEGAGGAWAAVHVTIGLDQLRAAAGCVPADGPFGDRLSTPAPGASTAFTAFTAAAAAWPEPSSEAFWPSAPVATDPAPARAENAATRGVEVQACADDDSGPFAASPTVVPPTTAAPPTRTGEPGRTGKSVGRGTAGRTGESGRSSAAERTGESGRTDESGRSGGAGWIVLSQAHGTLLSPQILRRIACQADLIPVVLGTAGEVLDQGRVQRLATPGLRRLLARRDQGCTFPGCDRPPGWCRAHHVIHWLDHGSTRPDCLALLCDRHHTIVHQLDLWAQVTPTPDEHGRSVHWDLTPGSYTRALTRPRAQGLLPDPADPGEAMVWQTDPELLWDDHLGWVTIDPLDWDPTAQTYVATPTPKAG